MNVEAGALIVVLGLGIAWSVHFEARRRAALKIYWARSCAGRAWREAFPDAPKDAIREFLYFVVDEFGFERGQALKLAPNDTLLGLYRACYPDKSSTRRDGSGVATPHGFRSLWRARFAAVADGVTIGELFSGSLARCVLTNRWRTRAR